MITELENKLHCWLWNGITGGVILGEYRTGKTRAVRYVSNVLVNRLKQHIPVRCLTIKPRDISTIRSIFKNLCFALEIDVRPTETADDMANILVHHFAELAESNATRQVVLIVDEVQRLNVKQLEAFAELYDNLSELQVNLSVIFVGNYEATKPLLDQVLRAENELIRGRFFTQAYSYYGIRKHEELKACLSAYDKPLQDGDSAVSITQELLKEEYNHGFRLAGLSTLIWEIYDQEYRRPLKLKSWGMQYFTSMVKALATDYLPRYGIENEIEVQAMISESIKVSGLVPDLVQVL